MQPNRANRIEHRPNQTEPNRTDAFLIKANGHLLGRLGLHGRLGLLDESSATKHEMLCSST
jgi:hypothetical protein